MDNIQDMTVLDFILTYWYIGFLWLLRTIHIFSNGALDSLKSIVTMLSKITVSLAVKEEQIDTINKKVEELKIDFKNCDRCDK